MRHWLLAVQAVPGQPNAHPSTALASTVKFAAQFVSSAANVRQLILQHQLTDMEAQTVCLHTLDSRQHGGLREHSVFYAYNAVLRSGQANALAMWSEHSFLFCSVLKKLTCVAATGPAAHTVVSLDLQGQYSLAEFCHFHLCAEGPSTCCSSEPQCLDDLVLCCRS